MRAVYWLWEKAFMCHFIVSSSEVGDIAIYLRREIPKMYISDILLSTNNTSQPRSVRAEEFADHYSRNFVKILDNFKDQYISCNWHGIFTPDALKERRPGDFWGRIQNRTGRVFVISDPRVRKYTGYESWL